MNSQILKVMLGYQVKWFIVILIYQGLLAISYVVHDPFGEEVQIPKAAIMGFLWNDET